ncbi:hypothetical protein OIV83_001907 [Microbotryomycetes sp. JL201]|nr:hypothetical protein OIV83_001907 [Microbotryomycetes sp. JL201]
MSGPTAVAAACVRRAIERVDAALKEESYVRPSRQRTEPRPVTTGSCSNCKRLKAKCDDGGPGRKQPGRKQGLSKRVQTLTALRTDLVEALRQLEAGVGGSGASPATIAHISPASTASPGGPPTNSSFGSSSTSAFSLPPAFTSNAHHVSPSPGTELALAATQHPPPLPLDTPIGHPQTASSNSDVPLQHTALEGIDNPLEVLAHVSLTDDKDEDDHVLDDTFASAVKEEQDRINAARKYYGGPNGLYSCIDDTDIDLDPVTLDILSERDLRRLVALYFDKLQRFFFHLDRQLHTPDFLRNTSPFLTTALCYVAATYDQQSSPSLVESLRIHVDQLATRCFKKGLKSGEIVQSYLLLVHWAPPAETWVQDRAWAWLGEALRIATEIRMDKPMDEERLNAYRARTPLTTEMAHRLKDSTLSSWFLLWSANLMLAVHSGRVVGKSFIGALRSSLPTLPPGHRDYMYNANELLNRILANALNLSSRLLDKPLSDSFALFDRSWRGELDAWVKNWPEINQFIQIRYWNVRIMLLSLGFKFSPPTKPVLAQVQQAALATLRIVPQWAAQEDALKYASNSAITNIAYGATLLLKIISVSDPTRDPNLKAIVLDLCSKVVDVLIEIGKNRKNAASIASLQAARMQSLLKRINPLPTPVSSRSALDFSTLPAFDLRALTAGTGGPAMSSNAPLAFSPTSIGLPFDFSTDNLGDTSMLFEGLSSSNLLSMMGDEVDVTQWNWAAADTPQFHDKNQSGVPPAVGQGVPSWNDLVNNGYMNTFGLPDAASLPGQQ